MQIPSSQLGLSSDWAWPKLRLGLEIWLRILPKKFHADSMWNRWGSVKCSFIPYNWNEVSNHPAIQTPTILTMIPSFVNLLWEALQPADVEMALRDSINSTEVYSWRRTMTIWFIFLQVYNSCVPAPLHTLQDQLIDSHSLSKPFAATPEPPVNGSIPPLLHKTTPFDCSLAIKIDFSGRLKPFLLHKVTIATDNYKPLLQKILTRPKM